MAQAPNPMQGFNDWLAYQQSMMEKMTAVMTEATPKNVPGNLNEMGLQNQAKALTDAWTTQTQRANEAIAQMTKAWTDATAAAGVGSTPGLPTWPGMPNLMDPALQDKVRDQLKSMLGKFGVGLPDMPDMSKGLSMPSVADAMLERMTKAPAFAHLWDMDQKLVGLMASWTKLHTANLAYRTLVAQAWTQMQQAALQKATQDALSAKAPAAPIAAPDWAGGMDAWLADLNAALVELMRKPEYGKAQKQLVEAGTEVREQLSKLGDEVAPWFQLPGRDEVDDLAKSVADMRKQLRSFGSGGAAADAAPPKAAARRSTKR